MITAQSPVGQPTAVRDGLPCTENVCKIYAESFRGKDNPKQIHGESREIVATASAAVGLQSQPKAAAQAA